jgi:hypothetical protein
LRWTITVTGRCGAPLEILTFREPVLSKTWANSELWTLALRGADVKDPS